MHDTSVEDLSILELSAELEFPLTYLMKPSHRPWKAQVRKLSVEVAVPHGSPQPKAGMSRFLPCNRPGPWSE